MTPDQFENLRDEFLIHEARILDWKAGEYTANRDRLLNFKQVAELLNRRPAEVALAYLLKHVQSITLAVRTGHYAWAWETESGEGLKQRIADARNYLLLLAACLEDEQLKEPEKWWYTAPGALAREEAIAAFRTRFGRDPDEVGKLGEGSPYSLWCMGPINDEESKRLGKVVQDED